METTKKLTRDFDPRFKIFHELMSRKVREVCLVSSLYDACIMEEDGRLSEKIINEYRGLNLSQPPRISWMSSAEKALQAIDERNFDMVITMLSLSDMDAYSLGAAIKKKRPNLPVILLSHNAMIPEMPSKIQASQAIDRTFVWSGNADILVGLIKSEEDRLNVAHDTATAGVRVILVVEDSPEYASALLPLLYKEVVTQTQMAMEEGLNEEHRLLTMRARPKILFAENFEEASSLYEKYKPYILGVISDMRFPKDGVLYDMAGTDFLSRVKDEQPDVPLLLTSSESANRDHAQTLGVSFVDKNSPSLLDEVRSFFLDHLGFGDFVARDADGSVIATASNLRGLERILPTIPDKAFYRHWSNNDISRWLFARSEILLASRLRPAKDDDFGGDIALMRQFILDNVKDRRKKRQSGIVVNFDADDYDPETDFAKIGNGSLGGKARGLAFLATLLSHHPQIHDTFSDITITIPKTLVVTTDAFDDFIFTNNLKSLAKETQPDQAIKEQFLAGAFPQWVEKDLRAYLAQTTGPIAVRSSALLEDARFRAYAGLYKTLMLANNSGDLDTRTAKLIEAIKTIYASTYFAAPRAFAKRVGHRTEDEKMAIIIQPVVGDQYDNLFFPSISGVAQSTNYYPFARMKPEEGIAAIALGIGKTVVDGEQALRFSPARPQLLPQFSTVDDILKNSQHQFYALNLDTCKEPAESICALEKLPVKAVSHLAPINMLFGSYSPAENAIRDAHSHGGHPVLTFSAVLHYVCLPLARLLTEALDMGRDGLGGPVEIEFAVRLLGPGKKPEFSFLQIRPMSAKEELKEVDITTDDRQKALFLSHNALGNVSGQIFSDIVYVRPESFDPKKTREIAQEIGQINASLAAENIRYLLMGPGRWGSADKWLGIPVTWAQISGIGAIVETDFPGMIADPSQGSHFFHNITTMGINYITVKDKKNDILHWDRILSMPEVFSGKYVSHVRPRLPMILKVDGRRSVGVMLEKEQTCNMPNKFLSRRQQDV